MFKNLFESTYVQVIRYLYYFLTNDCHRIAHLESTQKSCHTIIMKFRIFMALSYKL